MSVSAGAIRLTRPPRLSTLAGMQTSARYGRAVACAIVSALAGTVPAAASPSRVAPAFHGEPHAEPSLAAGVDVRHYALDLTLSGGGVASLDGIATITAALTEPADAVTFDLVGLDVSEVDEAGAPLAYAQTDSVLRVFFGAPRAAGESFTLAIHYGGVAAGGYFSYPRNSYTFAEPSDARRWFPCHDDPGDKADSALVRITVPAAWPAFSNGVLDSAVPGAADGTTTWTWRESHPIATYLLAISFGDYATWADSAAGVPLTYAVFPEDVARAQYDFATVPDMMAYFQSIFGPYPFDKYGMVAVDPFVVRGMEHQSMTTIVLAWLTGDRANEPGFAHELAHQWFGDELTPHAWSDIWLNEGFATYGELMYRQHAHGDSAFRAALRQGRALYFGEDATARYPIFDPPRDLNGHDYLFGLAVYYKGAWVLHMLRSMLGDAAYTQILQTYVQRHAYGSVSTPDFQQVCEEVSGESLQWFFDQWVYQAGYPQLQTVALGSQHDDGSVWINVGITQAQTNAPLFRLPMAVRVTTPLGDTTVTQTITGVTASYYFPVRAWPTSIVLDPDFTLLFQQPAVTAIEALPEKGLALSPPRPSPWSDFVDITVTVGQAADVAVTVHDARGRLVRELCHGAMSAGGRVVRWDGRDAAGHAVPAGVYLIRAHRSGATGWQRTVKLR